MRRGLGALCQAARGPHAPWAQPLAAHCGGGGYWTLNFNALVGLQCQVQLLLKPPSTTWWGPRVRAPGTKAHVRIYLRQRTRTPHHHPTTPLNLHPRRPPTPCRGRGAWQPAPPPATRPRFVTLQSCQSGHPSCRGQSASTQQLHRIRAVCYGASTRAAARLDRRSPRRTLPVPTPAGRPVHAALRAARTWTTARRLSWTACWASAATP